MVHQTGGHTVCQVLVDKLAVYQQFLSGQFVEGGSYLYVQFCSVYLFVSHIHYTFITHTLHIHYTYLQ